MKATLNSDFVVVFFDRSSEEVLYNEPMHFDDFDEDDYCSFEKGQEVEVLKIIEDKTFASRKACIIFNPETNESYTIDSSFLTFETE